MTRGLALAAFLVVGCAPPPVRLGDFVPDAQIVFVAGRTTATIAVVDSSGAERDLATVPGSAWAPAWSPSGRRIAFQGNAEGNWDIYVLDADGQNVRNLTRHPANDECAAWSPDGSSIVFSSNAGGQRGSYEICIVEADGSHFRRLTSSPGNDSCPTWSPDGRLIAWTRQTKSSSEVWVMDAAGGNARPLVRQVPGAGEQTWSADGRWQAVHAEDWRILLVSPAGDKPRPLTRAGRRAACPDWLVPRPGGLDDADRLAAQAASGDAEAAETLRRLGVAALTTVRGRPELRRLADEMTRAFAKELGELFARLEAELFDTRYGAERRLISLGCWLRADVLPRAREHLASAERSNRRALAFHCARIVRELAPP